MIGYQKRWDKKASTAHFCQTIRDQDAMVHQQKRCIGLQDFHGAFFPITLFLTAGAVQNARYASRLEFKKDQIQKFVANTLVIGFLKKHLKDSHFWTKAPGPPQATGSLRTQRPVEVATWMPWSLRCIKKPSWRLFWHVLTLDELVTSDYLHHWDGSHFQSFQSMFCASLEKWGWVCRQDMSRWFALTNLTHGVEFILWSSPLRCSPHVECWESCAH